ncbi:unnamed protein product [Pleuronectes platessa]|uniref:Uncharacterized protein n=1 Tax=Pleuronectes platessa TaxID=8262 RepID=A0A9N7Z237_PLEPL|nr:unnamed protein product [Pleuronectes platessa]
MCPHYITQGSLAHVPLQWGNQAPSPAPVPLPHPLTPTHTPPVMFAGLRKESINSDLVAENQNSLPLLHLSLLLAPRSGDVDGVRPLLREPPHTWTPRTGDREDELKTIRRPETMLQTLDAELTGPDRPQPPVSGVDAEGPSPHRERGLVAQSSPFRTLQVSRVVAEQVLCRGLEFVGISWRPSVLTCGAITGGISTHVRCVHAGQIAGAPDTIPLLAVTSHANYRRHEFIQSGLMRTWSRARILEDSTRILFIQNPPPQSSPLRSGPQLAQSLPQCEGIRQMQDLADGQQVHGQTTATPLSTAFSVERQVPPYTFPTHPPPPLCPRPGIPALKGSSHGSA